MVIDFHKFEMIPKEDALILTLLFFSFFNLGFFPRAHVKCELFL
jgi:hypothetical protein